MTILDMALSIHNIDGSSRAPAWRQGYHLPRGWSATALGLTVASSLGRTVESRMPLETQNYLFVLARPEGASRAGSLL